MSQLKTDEDSLDWRGKTRRSRKTFSVGRKQEVTPWHFRALNEITYSVAQVGAGTGRKRPLPLGLGVPPTRFFTWNSS